MSEHTERTGHCSVCAAQILALMDRVAYLERIVDKLAGEAIQRELQTVQAPPSPSQGECLVEGCTAPPVIDEPTHSVFCAKHRGQFRRRKP